MPSVKGSSHLTGSFSLGRSQLKCDTHRKTLVLRLRVHTFSFTHLAKFTSACTCFFPLVLTTLWILWRQCPKMVGGLGIPHLSLHTHQAFLHLVQQLKSWPSSPASEGSLDLWLLARSANGGGEGCRHLKREVCFPSSAPFQVVPSVLTESFYPKSQIGSLALSWS